MTRDTKPAKLPKRKMDFWTIFGYMFWGAPLVVVAFVVLDVALIYFRVFDPRAAENRVCCANDLARTVKAMGLYGDENMRDYPTVVTNSYASVAQPPAGGDAGSSDSTTAAESLFTPGARKASQCLWLLVILGRAQPQQFVCRADEASASPKTVSASNENWASDFAGSKNLSYAMAAPWVEGELRGRVPALPVAPWWRNSADMTQPLLADGIKAGADYGWASEVCPAHYGAGSTIAYADGHVEWVPITKQDGNYALQVPRGWHASGGVFPSGTYKVPMTTPTTKVGGMYDMIFIPPLTGR